MRTFMDFDNLKMRDHFREREAERLGFFLRDPQTEKDIFAALKNDSYHIRDEAGNKEARLVRIYDRFWIAIVCKDDNSLVTIIPPSGADRTLSMKRFERAVKKDMSNETVQCYIQWRGELLGRQGWKTELPKPDDGAKKIIVWGADIFDGWWDGTNWLKENGHVINPDNFWGWMEIEAFEAMRKHRESQKEKQNGKPSIGSTPQKSIDQRASVSSAKDQDVWWEILLRRGPQLLYSRWLGLRRGFERNSSNERTRSQQAGPEVAAPKSNGSPEKEGQKLDAF